MPLIELKDISKIYKMGDEEVRANDHLSFSIEKGEFTAIVGKSGSGKSTVMNIIGALDVPTSGQYILNGEDVGEMDEDELAEFRNKTIGFVFQQYNLLPKQTILENVELPLLYMGYRKQKRKELAMAALERVGIADKYRNRPNQLSGGQQQRVSIARALAGSPSLILADEPTGALDSRTSREVLDFIRQLNDEGNTIILITHDNSIALEAKRIIRLKDGKVVFDGSSEDYDAQNALLTPKNGGHGDKKTGVPEPNLVLGTGSGTDSGHGTDFGSGIISGSDSGQEQKAETAESEQ